MAGERNYYEILGVKEDATLEQIRKAYQRLTRIHHPDKSGSSDDNEFKQIFEAYQALSNADARRRYDISLRPRVSSSFFNTGDSYAEDFSENYNRNKLKAKLSSSGLPKDMSDDLIEMYNLSFKYKNKYPTNDQFDRIFGSLITGCYSYIDAVINAYKENPTNKIVLTQGIRLIKTALQNPTEENIRKSREHANNLPSGVPKKLKLVGALTLGIMSFLIAAVGVAAIGLGIGALLIPANPISIPLIILGIGLIAAASGGTGIYGSLKLFEKIYDSPNLNMASNHSELIDDVEQRLPKPS